MTGSPTVVEVLEGLGTIFAVFDERTQDMVTGDPTTLNSHVDTRTPPS